MFHEIVKLCGSTPEWFDMMVQMMKFCVVNDDPDAPYLLKSRGDAYKLNGVPSTDEGIEDLCTYADVEGPH